MISGRRRRIRWLLNWLRGLSGAERATMVLAFPPLLASIILALVKHDWAAAMIFALLLLGAILILAYLADSHVPIPLPATEIFQPFGPKEPRHLWPRPTDVAAVVRLLGRPRQKTTPCIVGASGAGKSILLDYLVRKRTEEQHPDWRYEVVSDGYRDLAGTLNRLIPRGSQPYTIIVLDQFERWLAHVKAMEPDERQEHRRWLATTIKGLHKQSNCAIVLSVRREWYYDLRFLKGLAPAPNNVCDIQAPSTATAEDLARARLKEPDDVYGMERAMLESFEAVVGDRAVALGILGRLSDAGRLSPLRAQIVGAALETHVKQSANVDLDEFDDELGGVAGMIDAYLNAVRSATRYPDVCSKILCALSVKTQFREKTALHDIRTTLFEEPERVNDTLADLQAMNVINGDDAGLEFELAHDFLADFFTRKSGSDLDPLDRDNIFIHVVSGSRPNDATLDLKHGTTRRRFGIGVIATVAVLMLLRVVFPEDIVDVTLLGPSFGQPILGRFLDIAYIPVAVAFIAWATYVGLFYDRVLVNLKESWYERVFSVVLLFNLLLSMGIGIVAPFAWLLAISVAGVPFAVRLLRLAAHRHLNHAASKRMIEFGRGGLLNLVGLAFVGAGAIAASYTLIQQTKVVDFWLYGGMVASAIVTYWCITLMPKHITQHGTSQLLGLIGRPDLVETSYADA